MPAPTPSAGIPGDKSPCMHVEATETFHSCAPSPLRSADEMLPAGRSTDFTGRATVRHCRQAAAVRVYKRNEPTSICTKPFARSLSASFAFYALTRHERSALLSDQPSTPISRTGAAPPLRAWQQSHDIKPMPAVTAGWLRGITMSSVADQLDGTARKLFRSFASGKACG